MVILAIGQTSDLSLVPDGIDVTIGGNIHVDSITLETTLPGVFAGGDVASAAGSVADAIGAGKRAAVSIDRFLKGEDLREGRDKRDETFEGI